MTDGGWAVRLIYDALGGIIRERHIDWLKLDAIQIPEQLTGGYKTIGGLVTTHYFRVFQHRPGNWSGSGSTSHLVMAGTATAVLIVYDLEQRRRHSWRHEYLDIIDLADPTQAATIAARILDQIISLVPAPQ